MVFRRARFLSSDLTMYHGAMLRVGRLEHGVARARVLVPLGARRQVHGAQLPLPQRIVDARPEPPLLLLVADLEPELDEDDAAVDDVLLEHRAQLEEPLVLLVGAEPHHVLDAGAVVPAAVEDHDLAGRRESAACSAACTSGSSRGPTAPAAPRARNTRGLTRSVIALIVPPLPAASRPSKITIDAQPLGLHPLLQDAQLALQPASVPSGTRLFLSFLSSPSIVVLCYGCQPPPSVR